MDKIKPCPFCGGEAVLSDAGWKCKDGKKRYTAGCSKCGTRRCVRPLHMDKEIAVWNERVQQTEVHQYGETCTHISNSGTLNLKL